jgi:hypothetical protein
VGRTGTYIAIDGMIEKIKQERKIDIFHFVSQMRRERHLMVQTVVCKFEENKKFDLCVSVETICFYLSIFTGILSVWKYQN